MYVIDLDVGAASRLSSPDCTLPDQDLAAALRRVNPTDVDASEIHDRAPLSASYNCTKYVRRE